MSWKPTELSRVATISAGQAAPKDSFFSIKQGRSFIRAGHLQELVAGSPIEKLPTIIDDNAKRCNLKLLKSGSILFAKSGMSATLNRIYKLEKDAYFVSHLAAITPIEEKLNSDFCKFFFQFFKPSTLIKDSSYPSIGLSDISKIQIPLPSLPTQKRIAEILDKADALRKKHQQLLKHYDDLAQSLFIDIFGDPVKNEKGWEVKKIGEVCYYVKDGPHVSPKYSQVGIPFISVNNIIQGSIDLSNAKYITYEDYLLYSKKGKPEKGDILYTKGGTTGFAKRVDVDFEFMNWVHIAVLKFDKNVLNDVFFESMLNSDFCYFQSQRLTKGIANRDLVLGEMKKIKILLPPIALQEQFAEHIQNIEQQKEKLKAQLDESEHLFQGLLQQAFNGGLD